jgi:hypothetical protein
MPAPAPVITASRFCSFMVCTLIRATVTSSGHAVHAGHPVERLRERALDEREQLIDAGFLRDLEGDLRAGYARAST